MTSISRSLRDVEPYILPIIAEAWGLHIKAVNHEEWVTGLSKAMVDPRRAEMVWDSLSHKEQGAIQTLAGRGGKMPTVMFERFFGQLVRGGADELQKRNPLQNPQNIAEGLYYRGLIAMGFENSDIGAQAITYVPEEVLRGLPTHKTSYDNLEEEEDLPYEEDEAEASEKPTTVVAYPNQKPPGVIRQADTSIVDDLTTLLAYVQVVKPILDNGTLSETDVQQVSQHLLVQDASRLNFLLLIGYSAKLIDVQNGQATLHRVDARKWMSATRSDQLKTLADAWKTSAVYIELTQLSGIYPEMEVGTLSQYQAPAIRTKILNTLKAALPQQEWWLVESFVDYMFETDPDFQRPNGDYESWYIRDESGGYLRGRASWEYVEGSLLEFFVQGPLHWLGMVDLSELTDGEPLAHLTAYGRAFFELEKWPRPAETPEKLILNPDGTIHLSRKVSRYDRFQVMRFSTWTSAGQTYVYTLDGRSIERATAEGITPSHIESFLAQELKEELPNSVKRILEQWQGGAVAEVQIQTLMVLQTQAQETLDAIFNEPTLRRFLGRRLGPTAVAVLPEQAEVLRKTLENQGVHVDFI